MQVQPYLFLDGRCEEAVEFYKKALNAKVEMMMRFKDNPEDPSGKHAPPGGADKIMHCALRVGDSLVMLSDGHCQGKPNFQGFSLTYATKTEAEAEKLFGALSDGGEIRQPLVKTFFSPKFGMCADKFGVGWMVLVEQQTA
jgi:PhnB protein